MYLEQPKISDEELNNWSFMVFSWAHLKKKSSWWLTVVIIIIIIAFLCSPFRSFYSACGSDPYAHRVCSINWVLDPPYNEYFRVYSAVVISEVQNGMGDFSGWSHTWCTLIPSEFSSALLKWNLLNLPSWYWTNNMNMYVFPLEKAGSHRAELSCKDSHILTMNYVRLCLFCF